MPYSVFLIFFILLPFSGMLFAFRRSLRRIHIVIILTLAVLILAYVTSWDNYLVASGVKYYVAGETTLGYVPILEYLFFVLQALLTGLFALWLWRRYYSEEFRHRSGDEATDRTSTER
jgi:lycopene cyclase domain-containing protein